MNPLYDVSKIEGIHEAGVSVFQYNYYAPFFSMFTGFISKVHPGYITIFCVCAIFSITNLVLYSKVIAGALKEQTPLPVKIFILLSLTYAANFVLPTVGRPEAISTLLIFSLHLIYKRRNEMTSAIYNTLICCLFAILLATQIMGFYFCFLFYIIYEVLNSENITKTIWINVARFAAIMLLFVLVMSLSPNGFINTVKGIKAHGVWALTRTGRSLSLFFYFWMFAPLSFGFLIVFILCAVIYVRSLLARIKQLDKIQVALIAILHVFLIFGIPKFILYASPTVYNATQFIFPMLAYLVLAVLSAQKGSFKTPVLALGGLTYFAGLFIFIRWIFLFAEYKNSGKDYEHARVIASRYLNKGERINATAALWPIFDNPNDLIIVDRTRVVSKGDILFIQTINFTDAEVNRYLSKCTILYDWRTEHRANFLGLKLSNGTHSFSFVVGRVN